LRMTPTASPWASWPLGESMVDGHGACGGSRWVGIDGPKEEAIRCRLSVLWADVPGGRGVGRRRAIGWRGPAGPVMWPRPSATP
jgi:hypothetical protein